MLYVMAVYCILDGVLYVRAMHFMLGRCTVCYGGVLSVMNRMTQYVTQIKVLGWSLIHRETMYTDVTNWGMCEGLGPISHNNEQTQSVNV